MNAYFIDLLGETVGPLAAMAAMAVAALIVLWILWLILKRFRSGLFVSGGGKGNLPRLGVTDAVPVDSHRRLILVRRDNVEHLIMIGGPTDIVVESGIGKPQPAQTQMAQTQAAQTQPVQIQAAPPRMPIQATQPQSVPQAAPPPTFPAAPPPVQAQRPANVAAREALADVERGRPVRVPETQVPERRTEPPMVTTPPMVAQPSVAPAVSSDAPSVAQAVAPTLSPLQSPATVQSTARTTPELDLDKLLDELRPNPMQDRS